MPSYKLAHISTQLAAIIRCYQQRFLQYKTILHADQTPAIQAKGKMCVWDFYESLWSVLSLRHVNVFGQKYWASNLMSNLLVHYVDILLDFMD